MKLKYLAIFVFLSSTMESALAQGEFNIWYFGQAGLDFNVSPPQALINCANNTFEGTASISDSSGDLLFYADAYQVWDRNHQYMVTGTPLKGHPSATQTVLIVPQPLSRNLYYVFHVEEKGCTDLSYSIVNMDLRGGYGDIELANKNQYLMSPVAEKLTAVPHSNGKDYWIIAHMMESAEFVIYRLTECGLDPVPIIQTIGKTYHSSCMAGLETNAIGYMKGSHDQTKLAVAVHEFATNPSNYVVELFDFNAATGTLSNIIQLPDLVNAYGIEFSPDNTKLYVSLWNWTGKLYQYDISSGNPFTIVSSRTLIVDVYPENASALQLGPDDRIYMVISGNADSLAVIEYPNLSGTACSFVHNGIGLSGKFPGWGLPNVINGMEGRTFNEIDYQITSCTDSVLFNPNYASQIDSVLWDFGDTTSVNNSSTLVNPAHLFSDTGIFYVTLMVYSQCFTDTITGPVHVTGTYELSLGNDTLVCGNGTVVLDATTPNATYLWPDSTTGATFLVSQPGNYWVRVTHYCGVTTDTINVTYQASTTINLGNDTAMCDGEALMLVATTPGGSYLWQDNSTNSTYIASQQGVYWVEVTDTCGTIRDSITVTYKSVPPVNLGNDTSICQGDSLVLDALVSSGSYLWQDGSINPSLTISQVGAYWVQVISNGCSITDTFNLDFVPLPVVNFGNDTTLCPGTSLMLNVATPNATYLWQDTSTAVQYIVEQPGTYWVKIMSLCDTVSDTINISFYSSPIASAGLDTIMCIGDSIQLNGTGGIVYNWTPQLGLSNPNVPNPWASPLLNVIYVLEIGDSNGCSDADSISITVITPMVSVTNDTTICLGDTLQLSATGTGTFLWTPSSSLSNAAIANPLAFPADTTLYFVNVIDSNGCSTSDSVRVSPVSLPVLSIIGSSMICLNDTVTLTASGGDNYNWDNGKAGPTITVNPESSTWYSVSSTNIGCPKPSADSIHIQVFTLPMVDAGIDITIDLGSDYILSGSGGFTYNWTPSLGLNCTTCQHPTASPLTTTTYYLEVIDSNGCKGDDVVTIYIDATVEIFVPNLFSPNGDGVNDEFHFEGKGIQEAELKLYNRWGELVFISNSASDGWDGYFEGRLTNPGVFVFIIKGKYINGELFEERGNLTLIR